MIDFNGDMRTVVSPIPKEVRDSAKMQDAMFGTNTKLKEPKSYKVMWTGVDGIHPVTDHRIWLCVTPVSYDLELGGFPLDSYKWFFETGMDITGQYKIENYEKEKKTDDYGNA